MQPAGSHARQLLPVLRDEAHDLALPLVPSGAQRRLPAHLRAPALQREREVQHAQLLLGKGRRRVVLASCGLAACSHDAAKAILISNITVRAKPLRTLAIVPI